MVLTKNIHNSFPAAMALIKNIHNSFPGAMALTKNIHNSFPADRPFLYLVSTNKMARFSAIFTIKSSLLARSGPCLWTGREDASVVRRLRSSAKHQYALVLVPLLICQHPLFLRPSPTFRGFVIPLVRFLPCIQLCRRGTLPPAPLYAAATNLLCSDILVLC